MRKTSGKITEITKRTNTLDKNGQTGISGNAAQLCNTVRASKSGSKQHCSKGVLAPCLKQTDGQLRTAGYQLLVTFTFMQSLHIAVTADFSSQHCDAVVVRLARSVRTYRSYLRNIL